MQWLIDLVIEAIGIPPTFINRGDPAAFDYTSINFTKDAAWHDLDLSAIVPAGATAILLRMEIQSPNIAATFSTRKKTNTQEFNASTIRIQVANISGHSDMIVIPNNARVIQYKAGIVAWTRLRMTVAGWWL